MVLAGALIEVVGAILPWILAWFALGGNATSVETNIEHFGQAIVKGPVDTAVNAWIKVAIIGAGIGAAVLVGEIYFSRKAGIEVGPIPLTPVGVAPAPVFGASGGYTAAAGPVTLSQGVQAGSGASAPAHVVGGGGRSARRSIAAAASPRRGASFRRAA